jgi:hypothetical protein
LRAHRNGASSTCLGPTARLSPTAEGAAQALHYAPRRRRPPRAAPHKSILLATSNAGCHRARIVAREDGRAHRQDADHQGQRHDFCYHASPQSLPNRRYKIRCSSRPKLESQSAALWLNWSKAATWSACSVPSDVSEQCRCQNQGYCALNLLATLTIADACQDLEIFGP